MMFVCNLLRKAYGTDAYKGYAVNAAWCEKSSGSYVSWKLRPCDDPGFGWINGYNKRSWWMKLLQLLLRCWLGYIKPWHRLLAVWGAISNRGTGRANGSAQPLVLSRGLRLDRFWEELVVKFIQPLNPKTFEFYLTNSMFCSTHFQDGFDSLREKTSVTNDDIIWHWLSLIYLYYDIRDWIMSRDFGWSSHPQRFLRWMKFSYFWSCEESQSNISLNFPELWYPMESWHHLEKARYWLNHYIVWYVNVNQKFSEYSWLFNNQFPGTREV